MIIKATKTVTTEREISFPYYCKGPFTFYKAISEKEFIKVCSDEWQTIIEKTSLLGYVVFNVDLTEITAEEFNAKFNEVLTKIKEINNDN